MTSIIAPETIKETLDEICHAIGKDRSSTALPAPASHAQIQWLQSQVQVPLPAALRELYATHDGEPVGADALQLFCGYEFLSVAEAVDAHQFWLEARADWVLAPDMPNFSSYPPDSIEPVLADPGWIPFASTQGGHYLAIDMAPSKHGVTGQVINFGEGGPYHFQIATSFDAFLQFVLAQIQQGEWAHDTGYDTYLYDHLCRQWQVD